MEIYEVLKREAENLGASYFGAADITRARDFIFEQGGSEAANYSRSISIGIKLFDQIVDLLPQRDKRTVSINFRKHCYDIINERLNHISSVLAGIIQEKGYRSYPMTASDRIDDEKICAEFSHKLGARLAGLGWIGKSCLLITPDNGPRVRWVSILTDAPLRTSEQLIEDRCGDCNACVDICPVSAFSGRQFFENEPREARYDASKCDRYFKSMKTENMPAVCGLCVYVCPYGKK